MALNNSVNENEALKLGKNEVEERLLALDEIAEYVLDEGEKLRMVIVGGSALALHGVIDRKTYDIDAIEVPKKLVSYMEKLNINARAQTFVNNFPYNYGDRLVRIPISSNKIEYFAASLEDIVVAKLYSSRKKDKLDIANPEVLRRLDWDLLEHLVLSEEEAKASSLNDRCYRELVNSFYEYKGKYKP